MAMIVAIDFLRGLFVRYANRCWCWDLETKFVRKLTFYLKFSPPTVLQYNVM